MSDFVPPSLQEVWDWKKAAEEETRGMTREQLIEFYRRMSDEFEKRLGQRLPRQPRFPGGQGNISAESGSPVRE